jgi:hypothetical protein
VVGLLGEPLIGAGKRVQFGRNARAALAASFRSQFRRELPIPLSRGHRTPPNATLTRRPTQAPAQVQCAKSALYARGPPAERKQIFLAWVKWFVSGAAMQDSSGIIYRIFTKCRVQD